MKTAPTLAFEGGSLAFQQEGYGDRNGDGRLTFVEDDLDWEHSDESSVVVRSIRVPRSELEAIRDFLNKMLPANAT
jgi:hypothetical protein